MAIAFDSSSWKVSSSAVTTETFSHTCTWANRVLVVHTSSNAGQVSSVTYNWVALTKAIDITHTWLWFSGLWYLVNPTTWTNTISITGAWSTYYIWNAASYTWVDTVNPLNGTYSINGTSSTFTSIITSTINNCWHICWMRYSGATITWSLTWWAGTTIRSDAALNDCIADGNWPVTPAGSNTLTINGTSSQAYGLVWLMLRPLVATWNSNFFMFF